MMEMKELLRRKIAEQQGKTKGPVYWVGEQLKEICGDDPHLCEVVLQDLDNKEMTVGMAEKKIHDYARGNGGCCPPQEADRILRTFYGLPAASAPEQPEKREPGRIVDLMDFLG